MSELLKLAERCEAATGPDRELDAEVAIAIFDGGASQLDDARDVTRARKVILSHGALPGCFEIVGFSGVRLRTAPAYTKSLDAAMTLVPEGYALGIKRAPCQRSHAMLATIGYEANASGTTPALALCAAALRARDALTNSEGGGE